MKMIMLLKLNIFSLLSMLFITLFLFSVLVTFNMERKLEDTPTKIVVVETLCHDNAEIKNAIKINKTFFCGNFMEMNILRKNIFLESNTSLKQVDGNCTASFADDDNDILKVLITGKFDDTVWYETLTFWIRRLEWRLIGFGENCTGPCNLIHKFNVPYSETWKLSKISSKYGRPWYLNYSDGIQERILFKFRPTKADVVTARKNVTKVVSGSIKVVSPSRKVLSPSSTKNVLTTIRKY